MQPTIQRAEKKNATVSCGLDIPLARANNSVCDNVMAMIMIIL